jgi:hypothetical protein
MNFLGGLEVWGIDDSRLSAAATMRRIVSTTRAGCLPAAVSAESMTASLPSKIALATSDASARVGTAFSIIVSSICVATMQGLPHSAHFATISFCETGTRAMSISTPRSPRATMTPSAAWTILSRSARAWGFSILATTGIQWAGSSGSPP